MVQRKITFNDIDWRMGASLYLMGWPHFTIAKNTTFKEARPVPLLLKDSADGVDYHLLQDTGLAWTAVALREIPSRDYIGEDGKIADLNCICAPEVFGGSYNAACIEFTPLLMHPALLLVEAAYSPGVQHSCLTDDDGRVLLRGRLLTNVHGFWGYRYPDAAELARLPPVPIFDKATGRCTISQGDLEALKAWVASLETAEYNLDAECRALGSDPLSRAGERKNIRYDFRAGLANVEP